MTTMTREAALEELMAGWMRNEERSADYQDALADAAEQLRAVLEGEPGTEVDVEETVHWGCQLLREDGSVYLTRWNPGYGSGVYEPYTEAEARADVARDDTYRASSGFSQTHTPASRKRLVTRTETVTTVTTPWTVVEDA
jgi:hypothetical protein